jgi:hypothetical protein
MFHMTSAIIYWHAKNWRKLEIALPSVKEQNEGEYEMIVSAVSEFMSVFGDVSLFGRVSATTYPVLIAHSWSVRHHLFVYQILQFDDETTT